MLKLNTFEQTHIFKFDSKFKDSIFNLNVATSTEILNQNLKTNSGSIFRKNTLRLLESKEEQETSASFKKETSKAKYQKGYFEDFVLSATYKDNRIVFIPQNSVVGQTLPIYEFGRLESTLSERVVASITPEGVLRIGKGKYVLKKIISLIPGASLNFDNGIGLNQVRIKLSNGVLVPVLSQIKK